MKKIDPVVIKETCYIGAVSFIFSLILQSVFLIIGKWDFTVLLGNLLGIIAGVGNFFIMGLSVQKAVTKDEKNAQATMKLSQSLRMLLIFMIIVVAFCVNKYAYECFNIIAVAVPLLFPRIAIMLRPLFDKKK